MNIIYGQRDRFGVPMEPDEIIVFYDWQGEAIYLGDEYYDTPDGKVLADEIDDYLGGKKVAEYEL